MGNSEFDELERKARKTEVAKSAKNILCGIPEFLSDYGEQFLSIILSAICFITGLSAFILAMVDLSENTMVFILFKSPRQIAFIVLNVLSFAFAVAHAIFMYDADGIRGILIIAASLCCVIVLIVSIIIVFTGAYWVIFIGIICCIFAFAISVANILWPDELIEGRGVGVCLLAFLLCCFCCSFAVTGAFVIGDYDGATDDCILYRAQEDETLAVAVYNYDSESLIFPAEINGRTVTRVERSIVIISPCVIKETTIPDSVIYIEPYALYALDQLQFVYFENTNGWQVSKTSDFANCISIDSAALSNASTAAEYLTSTYYDYYWRRV